MLWLLSSTLIAPLCGAAWNRAQVALLLVALGVASPVVARGLARVSSRLEQHGTARRSLITTLFLGSFLTQLRIGVAVVIPMDWDPMIVVQTAARISTGRPLTAATHHYFAQLPNNAFLTSLLSVYFRGVAAVGGVDLFGSFLLLNALSLTAAFLLAYLTARRIAGPTAAYLVLLLGFPFLTLSPWIAVPYSDTLGIAFPALSLYLSVRAREARTTWVRCVLWAGIGVFGAFGYAIKPTLVFAVVAAGAVTLNAAARPRLLSTAATVLPGLVLGFVVGVATTHALNAHTGLAPRGPDRNEAFPLTHFLKMGALQSAPPGIRYGGWSAEDVAQTAALPPGSTRFWGGFDTYRDRVAAMGPIGYVVFLNAKARWCFGDGSFFQWGEGSMVNTPFISHDRTSVIIQRVYGAHGDAHGALLDLWQACWLLVLALMTVPLLLGSRTLRDRPATQMRLAILMLLVFLLFFEGRARYVYVYVPYFVQLAALSLEAVSRQLPFGTRRTAHSTVPD
ncbi:MAG: glycosyltransferase family 39 protein [Nocardioidaceae bacterium]